jgi:hypothetical protein
MASAPLDAKNWKTMMLAGDVRPELGRQCGELLAKQLLAGVFESFEEFFASRLSP